MATREAIQRNLSTCLQGKVIKVEGGAFQLLTIFQDLTVSISTALSGSADYFDLLLSFFSRDGDVSVSRCTVILRQADDVNISFYGEVVMNVVKFSAVPQGEYFLEITLPERSVRGLRYSKHRDFTRQKDPSGNSDGGRNCPSAN